MNQHKELTATICNEAQKQSQENANPSGPDEIEDRANPPRNRLRNQQEQFFYETRQRHEP